MHPFSKRLILCDRTVEFGRREVRFGDERLRLSPLEAAALAYLSERPNQPVTRGELLREVWGYAPQVRSRAADITISRLRQQIEADPRRPRHLVTVRGVGYRFIPLDRAPSAPPDERPASGRPPRPLGTLFGRAAELSALRAAAGRLLVVQGPPGVGKTRLVLAHAAELEARGQAVWWCPLSEVHTAEGFEEALAQSLGVPLSEEGSAAAQIGYALAGRGAGTLLLDTLEHLPPSCGVQLLGWLRAAPALRAVVTSRRRLGLADEQLMPLSGLPPAEAAALLQARARQVGVHLSAEGAAAVAAALDGNPLSIELAAAWTAMLSPAQLLSRLEEPLSVLRRSGAIEPRHASLERALAWSWRLLSATEQAALAQLTAFRGGFTAADAEAILDLPGADSPLAVLSALVDHSLVTVRLDAAPRRFFLSRAVRQFAATRLADPAGLATRHAAHFAGWAQGELARAETAGLTQALPRLRAARENLLAVLPAATPPQRAWVTLALLEVGPSRQPTAAAQALLAQALSEPAALPAPARGRLLAHRAALHINAGLLDEAEADIAAAEQAAADDTALQVAAGRQRGRLLMKAARWEEAEAVAEACSAAAATIGATESRFVALLDQAFSTFMRYDLAQTEVLLEQAGLLYPELRQTRWGGRLKTVLAAVYRGQGRLDAALEARRASLSLFRHHNDLISAASALMDLSRYHFYLHGTPDTEAWAEAERLCQQLGERRLESHLLEQAAHLAVDAGRCVEAEATLRRFREVSEGQVIAARREFTGSFLLALVRLQQRRYAEAAEAAAAARAASGDVAQFVLLGDIVSGLTAIYTGQHARGRAWLAAAVAAARERDVQEIVYALCYLAVLEADDGHPAAAAVALDEASSRLRAHAEPVQTLLHRLCAAWVSRGDDPEAVAAALEAATSGSPPPVSMSVDLRLAAARLHDAR